MQNKKTYTLHIDILSAMPLYKHLHLRGLSAGLLINTYNKQKGQPMNEVLNMLNYVTGQDQIEILSINLWKFSYINDMDLSFEWKSVKSQISWLLMKPADLGCTDFQRKGTIIHLEDFLVWQQMRTDRRGGGHLSREPTMDKTSIWTLIKVMQIWNLKAIGWQRTLLEWL